MLGVFFWSIDSMCRKCLVNVSYFFVLDVYGLWVSVVVCRFSMGGFLSLVFDIMKFGFEVVFDGGGFVLIFIVDFSICGSIFFIDFEIIFV